MAICGPKGSGKDTVVAKALAEALVEFKARHLTAPIIFPKFMGMEPASRVFSRKPVTAEEVIRLISPGRAQMHFGNNMRTRIARPHDPSPATRDPLDILIGEIGELRQKNQSGVVLMLRFPQDTIGDDDAIDEFDKLEDALLEHGVRVIYEWEAQVGLPRPNHGQFQHAANSNCEELCALKEQEANSFMAKRFQDAYMECDCAAVYRVTGGSLFIASWCVDKLISSSASRVGDPDLILDGLKKYIEGDFAFKQHVRRHVFGLLDESSYRDLVHFGKTKSLSDNAGHFLESYGCAVKFNGRWEVPRVIGYLIAQQEDNKMGIAEVLSSFLLKKSIEAGVSKATDFVKNQFGVATTFYVDALQRAFAALPSCQEGGKPIVDVRRALKYFDWAAIDQRMAAHVAVDQSAIVKDLSSPWINRSGA